MFDSSEMSPDLTSELAPRRPTPRMEPCIDTILLAALVEMAMRSKRRQADVGVAVLRAGLDVSADRIETAIRVLTRDGCLENVVPLSDGGLLASVTTPGMERVGRAAFTH